jgi:hypothetical protein
MSIKRKSPWRPCIPSNEATMQAPKFLAGDPIVSIDDGEPGRVEFARHDAMCCVTWDASGRREWVHEDVLQFAPGFAPVRRR